METERLILRPWTLEDLNQLFEIAKDEQVGPDCGWKPHKDLSESEFVLKNILMTPETYAIVLKETNEVIGNISLFKSDYCLGNEQEIGFWLGRPYWGKGYMPEACHKMIDHCFNDLQMNRVWCSHNEINLKSKRVQEKCGFKYHHTEPNHYLNQLDITVVSITNVLLKEDYMN